MKTNYLAVMAALTLLVTSAAPAMAAEAVPRPEDAKASLTVSFVLSDTKEGTKTAISGATFEITRVADLNWHGGSPEYILTDEFAGTDVDFNGMTASQSEQAAETFASMQVEALASRTTGEDGSATFAGLDHGIYLVEETAVTGTATDYSTVDPYLVLVPGYEEGAWQYEVTSSPKTDPVEKPKPEKPETPVTPVVPTQTVKTGDTMNVYLWTGVALCAASAILIMRVLRKRRKEDKHEG